MMQREAEITVDQAAENLSPHDFGATADGSSAKRLSEVQPIPVSVESAQLLRRAGTARAAKSQRKAKLPAWTQGPKTKVGRNALRLRLLSGRWVRVETWFRKGFGFAVMSRGIVTAGATRDATIKALVAALEP